MDNGMCPDMDYCSNCDGHNQCLCPPDEDNDPSEESSPEPH